MPCSQVCDARCVNVEVFGNAIVSESVIECCMEVSTQLAYHLNPLDVSDGTSNVTQWIPAMVCTIHSIPSL